MNPKVRAAAVVTQKGGAHAEPLVPGAADAGGIGAADELYALVQCDVDESFYRFPGGTVEYGETTAEAIEREMMEEFDLRVSVGSLMVVNEHFYLSHGKEHHHITLLHYTQLIDPVGRQETLWHNEHSTVKLVWRPLSKLRTRPLYPDGILRLLEQEAQGPAHLITGRDRRADKVKGCVFCEPNLEAGSEVRLANDYCLFLQMPQEVLLGSGVIVPRQHRETVYDLTPQEWEATYSLLHEVKKLLDREWGPDGYTVGWNVGPAGGQTVPHAHLHVVPRYADEPYAGKGLRHWIKQHDNQRSAVQRSWPPAGRSAAESAGRREDSRPGRPQHGGRPGGSGGSGSRNRYDGRSGSGSRPPGAGGAQRQAGGGRSQPLRSGPDSAHKSWTPGQSRPIAGGSGGGGASGAAGGHPAAAQRGPGGTPLRGGAAGSGPAAGAAAPSAAAASGAAPGPGGTSAPRSPAGSAGAAAAGADLRQPQAAAGHPEQNGERSVHIAGARQGKPNRPFHRGKGGKQHNRNKP
ncbi:HIT domain-containing protein [Paenibacillus sp. y28]|uniref:HIT domain-containing protein n=1 Tax=Paenibacillus sp. y28 TaxID=3129110 RepID=UPI003018A7E8